jgi:hypothetical protein
MTDSDYFFLIVLALVTVSIMLRGEDNDQQTTKRSRL